MLTRSIALVAAALCLSCGGSGNGEDGGGTDGGPLGAEEILFSDQFLNIAHRGGARVRPEHTLLAYEQALVDGAHVLELDVHATSDGVLVVMHDDTVDRTTDGKGAIKEMTFDALRAFDAGHDFSDDGGETFPFRGMGLQVPSLEEVFEAFPDEPYVIEIKQEAPSIVDAFVAMCEKHGIVDQMVGAAFSDAVIQELRRAAPDMATAFGLVEVADFYGLSPEREPTYEPPGEFLHVPTTFQGLDLMVPSFLNRAKRFGLKIHAWTINDVDEMRALIDLGVDGIMTDYPPRLRDVLNE